MRWQAKALTAGVLLAGITMAGPVMAKVVLNENFNAALPEQTGEAVPTTHGKGWRAGPSEQVASGARFLRYPASVLGAGGPRTVEFDLVRSPGTVVDNLFSLVQADGVTVLAVSIHWQGVSQEALPEIDFSTYLENGRVWYHDGPDYVDVVGQRHPAPWGTVLMKRPVAPGENVHVVISWGDTAAACAVYVDGEKLSYRIADPGNMRRILAASSELVIGAIPSTDWKGADYVLNSLMEYVRVHDTVEDGARLFADLGRYEGAPEIAAFRTNAFTARGFSGKLVAGNAVAVTLEGTPGGTATFDIAHYPDLGGRIELDWRGWGVYLEEKTFYDPGEVDLREVEGYDVYSATSPFDPTSPGFEPLESLEVGEQSYAIELPEVDTPHYAAVVARMRDGSRRVVISPLQNLPMTETAPGVYTGTYTVGWRQRFARAAAVGRLSLGGASATAVAPRTLEVDTALEIAVATEPSVLKADEKSESRVTVTVRDANGNAVTGHKIRFLLATTSQYTGVVGGGAFAEQVGGSITESTWGETDLFGRLTTTYVAGFAAKTAVIVARDMVSNSTGAGHVRTFIQNTAQIELTPVDPGSLAAEGYEITLASSDSWLTADGKSRARLTARVTLRGQPVEGHRVVFSVEGIGSVRVVQGTTDRNGEARAVYTAGRKIGVVVVRATDLEIDMSATVSIELRSDAPAKIAIRVDPPSIPADGRSRADILVTVTDINDNPNDNVEVEYALAGGSGEVRDDRTMTDRRGETGTTFVAGRTPGTASVEITVRSTVPTDAEMSMARDLAVAVPDHRFF